MALRSEEKLILENGDLHVRHLRLEGNNFEIGKKLGELARDRYGITQNPRGEAIRNRVRRQYLQRNYPIFHERMRGYAETYGINVDDDAYDLSIFGREPGGAGCTAAFYPPELTSSGHGLLGKNLDFVAWGLKKEISSPLAETYLLELHPDQGYASLAIMSFGALGQRLDGINSEGLVVVHLADVETEEVIPLEPAGSDGIGLGEMQAVEMLLDTCANVEEAKAALLSQKHYYRVLPVHLLIADRSGHSFIWEFSAGRNREHIIEGQGIQTICNFLLHRHPDTTNLPHPTDEPGCAYNRFQRLTEANVSVQGKYTSETVLFGLEQATFGPDAFNEPQPVRTVWREIWDTEERSLRIRFLIGETDDKNAPGGKKMQYTEDFNIRLGK